MSDNQQKGNFWTSLPGILTGIAAVITAVAGTSELIKAFSSQQSTKTENLSATTELKVYADSIKGEPFVNEEDKYVEVRFNANPTDKWLAIPESNNNSAIPESAKGYISAKGDLNFQSNTTPCRAPVGALIIIQEDGTCAASGEEGTFKLEPLKTVYFRMNDVNGLYQDNKGYIRVSLNIAKK